ncbi:MAG: hypothetical protein QUV05_04480 [Phycisphaerae bacterium]|nr:hypothetical protein [Phycisphaerae bacterium]
MLTRRHAYPEAWEVIPPTIGLSCTVIGILIDRQIDRLSPAYSDSGVTSVS